MENIFNRTALLIGQDNLNKLQNCNVLVFGLGGVGGYCVEALARSGICNLTLVDCDSVNATNINRQIIALNSTIGQNKTDLFLKRIKDINLNCNVNIINTFVDKDTILNFDFSKFDYVIDAIDTITSKLLIIKKAQENNIPVISCMGTGGKLNPSLLQIEDIYKTSVCPLCKVMRKLCKENNIKNLTVIYSKEQPNKIKSDTNITESNEKLNKQPIPSMIFVPASAGILIASKVVKDLIN